MRTFSFQIDPVADLHRRRAWNNRGFSIFALKLNFPALGTRASKALPKPAAMPNASRRLGQSAAAPAARPVPVAVCQFAREFVATRQTQYRGYAISTSRYAAGGWVASYGHPDGRLICVDGKDQAAPVTEQYSAESLALADAQLRIDALAAGQNMNQK